jgi:hypothetical protein
MYTLDHYSYYQIPLKESLARRQQFSSFEVFNKQMNAMQQGINRYINKKLDIR